MNHEKTEISSSSLATVNTYFIKFTITEYTLQEIQ